MRVTQHSGKTGKNGSAYTAFHNDRNFDLDDAEHIDQSRQYLNQYWNRYDRGWYNGNEREGKYTFDEAEQKFYQDHFTAFVNDNNERSRKSGHPERCYDINNMRKMKRYSPEELIIQIGDYEDHVDYKTFIKCAQEYMSALAEWSREHGHPMQLLDAAFHGDEAVPHLQIRRVWTYKDENGIERIGQEQALKKAGVPLPDPTKPEGRFNNRKMTFDKIMRDKLIEICERNGIEVDKEPDKTAKHNLTKEEFLFEKYARIRREMPEMEFMYNTYTADIERLEKEKSYLEQSLERFGQIPELQTMPIEGDNTHVAISKDDAQLVTQMLGNYEYMRGEMERLKKEADRYKKRYRSLKKEHHSLARFIESDPKLSERFQRFEARQMRKERKRQNVRTE